MMKCLPIHPFPMRTTFSNCILVNFAIDPHALKQKLPSHLEPDLHDGMGYVSIVIAKMENSVRHFCHKPWRLHTIR